MQLETRKILSNDLIKIAVTCVRVPIIGGHGESVNFETERAFTKDELMKGILPLIDEENNKSIIYDVKTLSELFKDK